MFELSSHYRAILAGLVVLPLVTILALAARPKRLYPLPPGPPGEFLIGHLRKIPTLNPEHQYIRWGKECDSEILYLNVLGQSIIIINSVRVAHDLLDKRGGNYADRPRFVLFELMGWGVTLTFLRWGPQFKLHRRLLQQSFTPSACQSYKTLQQEEAQRACHQILLHPQDWEKIARRFSSAVVLRIGFGVEISNNNDQYIQMAIDAENATGGGGTPAGSIVDFFPPLRYIPNFLALGEPFRPLKHARDSRFAIQRLHDAPWAATEPAIKIGTAKAVSFMRTHYESYTRNVKAGRHSDITLRDIKGAAGAISIAGGNTTWSTIVVCILNLILYRDVQKKVKAEIDAVTGGTRLPTFDDRNQMPYLEYVIQETTRMVPLSPLGVPHATIKDDIYEGMLIPKGSIVFANAQAMTHDENIYSQPNVFNPDRYAPKVHGGFGEPLPEGPFGFGRRVCVGKHLALAGVYIFMSTLLATFDVKAVVGEDGKEIPPHVGLTNGLSSRPEHFDCVITPRTEKVKQFFDNV